METEDSPKAKTLPNPLLTIYSERMDIDDPKYAAACLALLGITFLLKEDIFLVVGESLVEPEQAGVYTLLAVVHLLQAFLSNTSFKVL